MSKVRKVLLFIGVMFMVLLVQQPYSVQKGETAIAQAATLKMNKKKKTLKVGQTFRLEVKGTSQKVKWTSSDNTVATVNSNGKVTAKSEGTVVIRAEVAKKSFYCTITIKGKVEESTTSDSNSDTSGEGTNNMTTDDSATNNGSTKHIHQPCFVNVDKYYIELVKGETIQMDVYTNCGPLYFVDSNPTVASSKIECYYDVHYPIVITANNPGVATIGIINTNDSSLTKWIAVHVSE